MRLQMLSAQRIQQVTLARGWSTWLARYDEAVRQQNLLRGCAAKLAKPVLVYSLARWRRDYEEEQRLAAAREMRETVARFEGRAKELEAELWQVKSEGATLNMQRTAQSDEWAALVERNRHLAEESLAARRREEEALIKMEENATAMEIASAKAARDAHALALEQVAKEQASMQSQLEQLLADQRRQVEEELTEKMAAERGSAQLRDEQRQRLEAQLRQANEDLRAAREEIIKLKGQQGGLRAPPPPPPKAAKPSNSKRSAPPPVEERYPAKNRSVLGAVDIDEDSGLTVSEQLRTALSKNAGRVIDLFREWDVDGDGMVERHEFHRAMKQMKYDVPKKAIDELYDSWDPDGSGTISYEEIKKILVRPPTMSPPPVPAAAQSALAASALKSFGKESAKKKASR